MKSARKQLATKFIVLAITILTLSSYAHLKEAAAAQGELNNDIIKLVLNGVEGNIDARLRKGEVPNGIEVMADIIFFHDQFLNPDTVQRNHNLNVLGQALLNRLGTRFPALNFPDLEDAKLVRLIPRNHNEFTQVGANRASQDRQKALADLRAQLELLGFDRNLTDELNVDLNFQKLEK